MNSPGDLFLGVDGGQSSTKALIGDNTGRILGRGSAGPCNHVTAAEARAKFLRTITECVSAAKIEAGIPADVRFRAACFGMSGGPEDKDVLLREVVAADQWLVTHDGLIALSGALAGDDGVVAIAGTGSFIFGRRGEQTRRAGGWGYIFGDEGSAFWIARQALRAALRYEEGWGPRTLLLAMLLDATGAPTANDVLHLFYAGEWPRSRVARLAAAVGDVAEEGDAVAKSILESAADALAEFAGSVRHVLWPEGEKAVVQASYIGGVFRNPAILSRFTEILGAAWNVQVHPPVYGGDTGALLEAYRLAGIRPSVREV